MNTPPFFLQQFWDPVTGKPAAGGSLAVYEAGSATLADIWSDRAGLIPRENPMPLNGLGIAPQYFVQPGQALDYKAFNASGASIFTGLDVMVELGAGGGGGDHMVAVSGADNGPGFLGSKLVTSPSVIVQPVPGISAHKLQPAVDENWLMQWLSTQGFGTSDDHRVAADGAGNDVPGFLVTKLTDLEGHAFQVSAANGHRVVIPLQDYLAKAGGHVTGATTIDDLTVVSLRLPSGASGMLVVGVDGTVSRQAIPQESGKVRSASGDSLGYLSTKIRPGTGVQITETVDGVNGRVLHISAVAPEDSGGVQEDVVPFSSAYSFGSSTAIFDLASLILDAGTYEVDASVTWNCVGSFQGAANISTASASIPSDGWDQWTVYNSTFSGSASVTIARKRIVVPSDTQTVYLCAQGVLGSFTGGKAWGHLTAKRIA